MMAKKEFDCDNQFGFQMHEYNQCTKVHIPH